MIFPLKPEESINLKLNAGRQIQNLSKFLNLKSSTHKFSDGRAVYRHFNRCSALENLSPQTIYEKCMWEYTFLKWARSQKEWKMWTIKKKKQVYFIAKL